VAEFHQAIEAQLSGATVRAASLVMFDFVSGPVRVWPGFGPLVTGGETYQGLGNLGLISAFSAGPGQVVEEMTFQLFADEATLGHFSDDAEESAGREANVYMQFFEIRKEDAIGNWVEWQPLDAPFQVFWGKMGPLTAERPEADENPMDARLTRALSVTASNAFTNRARPAFGFYTDRDQKARHPGDNMFINAYQMADKRVRWPKF
jgi:hypothetical protein